MSTQKILLIVLVIVALGAGYWYMNSQSDTSGDEVSDESISDTSKSEESTAKYENSYSGGVSATVTEDTSINSDLKALDGLFDEEYNDSSLDAEFSGEGSNSLSDPYEY